MPPRRYACPGSGPILLLFLTLLVFALIQPLRVSAQTCQPDGDVTQDSSLTAADALRAFQQALGIADPPLNACELSIADVYPRPGAADGNITAADALCIFRKVLSFPSCLDAAPGNGKPVAEPVSLRADPAVPYVDKQLIGTDPDNDTLTFELLDTPSGDGYTDAYLDPQSGVLYVTLAAGFSGEILLHYRVTDGQLFSAPATVQIIVEVADEDNFLGSQAVDPEDYAGFERDYLRTSVLPPRVDLSANFPQPGDQGAQSSCVGWATAYALKSYQEKLEIGWSLNTPAHLFSPAWIYNQINDGRDEGSYIHAALNLIVRRGAATWATMPYDVGDFLTQPSTAARQEAANFRGRRWLRVNDTTGIKSRLANRTPVVIGIDTYQSFLDIATGPNAVYNTISSDLAGGHAVTITGYDDDRFGGAFRAINSWGVNWGDGGYFWLPYSFLSSVMTTAYVLEDTENSSPVDIDPTEPVPWGDLPNLQVQSWSATYDPRPRGEGELQYTVINTGTGVVPGGTVDVNLMLSHNQTISGSDVYVAREKIPFDMSPGDTAVREQGNPLHFAFPDGLPEGIYYLALWVDDLDEVEESDENDNVSLGASLVTIESSLPDLYVRSWYAQWDEAGDGELTYWIENVGKSEAARTFWDISLVLSPDETIGNDNEIFLFSEESLFSLYPGDAVYRDSSIPVYFNIFEDQDMIPVPTGDYFMALWVDHLEELEESNEWNNTSLSGDLVPISNSRDRLATSATGKTPVTQGQSVSPDRHIPNHLYNGKELPAHHALVRKVRIQRTPAGGMSINLVEDETSPEDETLPLVEQSHETTYFKQTRSADTVIFPIVEEHAMP